MNQQSEKISDEEVALDVADVVRAGGELLGTLEPEMAAPLERLARWAHLNGYQRVSASDHAAIERGELLKPDMRHEAIVTREPSGWVAQCTCGWKHDASCPTERWAGEVADRHVVQSI